jgi:hypothetical protein
VAQRAIERATRTSFAILGIGRRLARIATQRWAKPTRYRFLPSLCLQHPTAPIGRDELLQAALPALVEFAFAVSREQLGQFRLQLCIQRRIAIREDLLIRKRLDARSFAHVRLLQPSDSFYQMLRGDWAAPLTLTVFPFFTSNLSAIKSGI